MSDWMDLEELRSVQTRERATDGLQDLRDSFYEDVATYLASLRESRREAAADAEDPFRSPVVNDLTDEIETAERVAEAIYERRIGKLLKEASLAASGMADDPDGLTAEERALYGAVVDLIEEHKDTVLSRILGAGTATENVPTSSEPESDATGGAVPSEDGPAADSTTDGTTPDGPSNGTPVAESDPSDRPPSTDETGAGTDTESTRESRDGTGETGRAPAEGVDGVEDRIPRTKVRITEDVGEILGVDRRSYSLRRDDIVDLPEENATPLVDRQAAERLE